MATTTYHWVITLQQPIRNGYTNSTNHGTVTAAPGETRQDLYAKTLGAVTSQNPRLDGAAVMFFSLEPNEL